MAMTKKHYEMVADSFKSATTFYRSVMGDYPADAIDALAKELAKKFAADNPNFDRAKFLKACGVQA